MLGYIKHKMDKEMMVEEPANSTQQSKINDPCTKCSHEESKIDYEPIKNILFTDW
jgi:hypothetical protein